MAYNNLTQQRVHISNIHPSVTVSNLHKVFPDMCHVSDVELKYKNVTISGKNTSFAFATIRGSPSEIEEWCDTMSHTLLKGLRLKVQKAKEDFMLRLKQEIKKSPAEILLRNSDRSEFVAESDPRIRLEMNARRALIKKRIAIEQKGDVPTKEDSNKYEFYAEKETAQDIPSYLDLDSTSKKKPNPEKINLADAKRLKSLEEKSINHMKQMSTIRQALSFKESPVNKKIIFDDEAQPISVTGSSDKTKATKSNQLFNESDESGDEDKYDFSADKPSYQVVQTAYSTCDNRFKLDHRFLEDEENKEKQIIKPVDSSMDDETALAHKVLDSILGDNVFRNRQPKTLENDGLVPRFDPLKGDHEKYVVPPKEVDSTSLKKSKHAPVISKERFYHISDDLSCMLKEPPAKSNSFSLLKMFGEMERASEDSNWSDQEEDLANIKKVYDSSDLEDDNDDPPPLSDSSEEICLGQGEYSLFFYSANDLRIKAASEFFKSTLKKKANKSKIKKIVGIKLKKTKQQYFGFKKKIKSYKKRK